ncbi:MAG: F0F1 ATP synthase subunit delta [Microgenomates group bacterium]|jgi:F0F1-type ATP synthase delta subunit
MATDLLTIILSDTYIKNQAEKKVLALKNYLLSSLFTEGKKTMTAKTTADNPELDIWIKSLDEKIIKGITPQNVYSVFDKTEADIKAVEPLVLYLPYDLPGEEITQIGRMLRKDYGPKFLIEVTIDPNLIAGCALSYKGIYKDYSVKQRISDNKEAILKSFKQYVKH